MTTAGYERLATAWIAFHRSAVDPMEEDPNFWAASELIDLAQSDPEECWSLVVEILARDQSAETLGNVAAGPLEDLLWLHGDQFIDRIEARAEADLVFQSMLGLVWASDLRSDLLARIRRAAGEV